MTDGFITSPFAQALEAKLADHLGGESNRAFLGDGPQLTVHKMTSYMLVSTDLLMDVGAIPDTREHKPIPLRMRFRWWRSAQRDRIAIWAYERISGQKFPDPYDD